jgi:uncharacterized protein YxjI
MTPTTKHGEQYTIRRKVFKVFGAGFHVYDAAGQVVGYCKQKAFKLKEDLRVFTDEQMSSELFRMNATKVIDFGSTYEVRHPTGELMGSLRRRGLKSLVRDSWLVFDGQGQQIATLEEDSTTMALLRRAHEFLAAILPQKFVLKRADGAPIATFRTHFNLFIYRLGVAIHTEDPALDDLMVLATGCLIAAIEGRQG